LDFASEALPIHCLCAGRNHSGDYLFALSIEHPEDRKNLGREAIADQLRLLSERARQMPGSRAYRYRNASVKFVCGERDTILSPANLEIFGRGRIRHVVLDEAIGEAIRLGARSDLLTALVSSGVISDDVQIHLDSSL
jgi:hypothetical protein